MTTSDPVAPREVYVWIWLPAAVEPVVAGRLARDGELYVFNYGRSYLERPDAIPIFTPELPLRPGEIPPIPPLRMASSLRDGAPDAWGRRVVINRLVGVHGSDAARVELDELAYMLHSGSDRAGALDFQASPTTYEPRTTAATLDALATAADLVERGVPLGDELGLALQHGTSVGGARPKAVLHDERCDFIAKLSSSTDTYPMVAAEYVAMRLAALAGLEVAPVALTRAAGRDVLLVQRFDRVYTPRGRTRRAMVSALTLFGLDELMAAHASYEDLTHLVRRRFTEPRATLRELFGRLTFNVLIGNTDDHARNHAAFWDGEALTLTPAYDVCPQARTGAEASQGMLIHGRLRRSQLVVCFGAAHLFLLREDEARELVAQQVTTIRTHWDEVCDEAALSEVDRTFLWRRQVLNRFAFEGLEGPLAID